MAKTATGKRHFLLAFPSLRPHIILETVTKSATKAANNKTRAKPGEVDAYMRVFTVSPADFSFQLVLTTH